MRDGTRSAWGVGLLLAAWLGVWGAWIPHQAAALRINAIDLAEWSTFLTEVQAGGLRLFPDLLRLAVVLAQIALSFRAGSVQRLWLRWLLRGLALLPCLLILPPYPFVLQLWASDSYGLRFIVAAVGIIGVCLGFVVDRAPVLRRASVLVLSLAAAMLGIWTFATLSGPFAIRYGSPFAPGWGMILFAAALIAAALESGMSLWKQRGTRVSQRDAAPGLGSLEESHISEITAGQRC